LSSREPDSAYPPPRKGGPDAYPSGTPPYGTGVPAGLGGDPFAAAGQQPATGPAADEDVPKTETTLTTRVRINIPGSRPIPPVVVRSPVKGEKAEPAEPAGPRHRSERGSGDPVRGVMAPGGAAAATPPNLPPEWQEDAAADASSEAETSGEWFKPRQKSRPEPAAVPAGAPERTAPDAQARRAPAAAGAAPASTGAAKGAPRPSGAAASPFSRPQPAEARGGTPGTGRGDGPANDPYASSPRQAGDRFDTVAAADPFAAPADPFAAPADPFAPGRPAGPQDGRHRPLDEEPEDTQIGGFDPIRDDEPAPGIPGVPDGRMFGSAPPAAVDPFAPGRSAAPADPFAPGRPGVPAADPFATTHAGAPAGSGNGGRFADVPYDPDQPFPGSLRAATPKRAVPEPETEDDTAADDAPARRPSRAPKLAVYALGGLLFVGAAAYGTGLMLNQSDIPKGTTVLGTDIGGDTRDQAVSALDESVAKTGQQPLKLKLGDQTLDLDPATAGLSFDTTATVDALTKHSYNPVEVIGSLTGGSKAVAPEVRVDRAKLKAALDGLGAKSGQGLQEGYVRFTAAGTTEVVPGKPGEALDSAAAVDVVEQAYRDRAAGRPDGEIALTVTAAQPKIDQATLQAAADSLGKQVLNGTITVSAGTKKFDFGKNTAATALTLAPDASGKIVPKWDLQKLDGLVGTSFDKLKFKKNGQLVPITTQDVADAITATFDKTGKDRVYKFPM